MVDRVLLGAFDGTYVLRVSRPGHDVGNGGLTPKQLAFDSRWPVVGQEYSRGSFVFNNPPTYRVTVPFGTTFSSPPIVLVTAVSPQGVIVLAGNRSGINVIEYIEVLNNQFTWVGTFQSARLVSPYTVYYTIYRNVYG